MKIKNHYWKVVRKTLEKNVYQSAVIYTGPFFLKYKVGIPVQADSRTQGIFVFKTRKDARQFVKEEHIHHYKIFKVSVKGEAIEPTIYDTYYINHGNFTNLPSYCNNKRNDTLAFPEITLLCEQSHRNNVSPQPIKQEKVNLKYPNCLTLTEGCIIRGKLNSCVDYSEHRIIKKNDNGTYASYRPDDNLQMSNNYTNLDDLAYHCGYTKDNWEISLTPSPKLQVINYFGS